MQEVIQELWSGYGQILRLRLTGSPYSTIVAKFIDLPEVSNHPRGWNSNLSHQRKVRSYQVEAHWYQHYNPARAGDFTESAEAEATGGTGEQAVAFRTPQLLASLQEGEQTLLLLEDLDAAGYPVRLTSVTPRQVELCLQWLAEFHAAFLQESPRPPSGLWAEGSYWHLATRPEELAALTGIDEPLQAAAPAIAASLRQARYQTLVHGDAKLANFCFSELASPSAPSGQQVAALDFQYVGGGCGMKDVAYFLGSCLDEETIARQENELLETYFSFLATALTRRQGTFAAEQREAVIAEWRALYPVAWTDFHRFLKGWCPTHWKLTSYSERLARGVLSTVSPL